MLVGQAQPSSSCMAISAAAGRRGRHAEASLPPHAVCIRATRIDWGLELPLRGAESCPALGRLRKGVVSCSLVVRGADKSVAVILRPPRLYPAPLCRQLDEDLLLLPELTAFRVEG